MDFFTIIFGSMSSFWLIGSVLWAFVGLVAASRLRLSLWAGALAGGFGWLFGVVAICIVGSSKRHAPAVAGPLRSSSVTAVSAVDPFGAADRASWSTLSSSTPSSVGPPSARNGPGTHHRAADPFGQDPNYGPEPLAATDLPSASGREVNLLLLAVVGGLCGLALACSAFLPWASGSLSWVEQDIAAAVDWSPWDLAVTGVMVTGSGALVIAMAWLFHRYRQGRFLAAAVLVAGFWFTVAIQVVMAGSVAGTVTETVSSVVQFTDQHGAGAVAVETGAWLAAASGVVVMGWALLQLILLDRWRHRPMVKGS